MGFIILVLLTLSLVPVCRSDELSKYVGVLEKVSNLQPKKSNGVLSMVSATQWQCLANCGLEFAKSVKSYQPSGTKMTPLQFSTLTLSKHTADMTPEERKAVYEQACLAQSLYAGCLKTCPDDLVRRSIEAGMSTVELICGDMKDNYVASIPCLTKRNDQIRNRCKEENNQLTAASLIYHNPQISKSPAKLLKAMRTFCLAYLQQSRCALPAVKDLCGDSSAELFISVLQRTHESTMNLMATSGLQLPSECQLALGGKPKLIYYITPTPMNDIPFATSTIPPQAVLPPPPIISLRSRQPTNRDDDFDIAASYSDMSSYPSTSTSVSTSISTFLFIMCLSCLVQSRFYM